jgi:hypothetical protein
MTKEERIAQLRAELAQMPREQLPLGAPDHLKLERSIKKETLLAEILALEGAQ